MRSISSSAVKRVFPSIFIRHDWFLREVRCRERRKNRDFRNFATSRRFQPDLLAWRVRGRPAWSILFINVR